ncbi:helix-turn-helix domain-containing protein [Companilactobacillus suantsaicola]|uniref:Helix-turn-helix domain-containing protein n=1 Tax=Companilactobacillus suantsaicola TaxID=2487723 RepID=A0A4Z0JFJ5_9LACO|nr:helix-turn-helix domain-containing protein [Companilactobacillus suantsaicola]TGD21572.1 helix-turn-helix domain-containing protein [Companilactobacillus suantsaicola]
MYPHSKKTIAVPPGATIKEQLQDRHMSQKEFAIRMDMSEKHISHLINGKVELTNDVAQRLESVLGVPAPVWNNLESRYRERLAKVSSELTDEREMNLVKRFPYQKMSVEGWVSKTDDYNEQVRNLRRFFEVANLKVLYTLGILDDCEENEDFFLAAKKQANELKNEK